MFRDCLLWLAINKGEARRVIYFRGRLILNGGDVSLLAVVLSVEI